MTSLLTASSSVQSTAVLAATDDWDGPGAWWPVFPALWLLLIVGVITTVVVLRRRDQRHSGVRAGEARLAERYAAGEIDEQEYQERRSVLRAQR